jgi:hypothetical protein
MRIKINFVPSDTEILLFAALRSVVCSDDFGSTVIALVLGLLLWLPTGGHAANDTLGILPYVCHAFGTLFLAAAVFVGIPQAFSRSVPYFRLARWVRAKETQTGQRPLFPHSAKEIQFRRAVEKDNEKPQSPNQSIGHSILSAS